MWPKIGALPTYGLLYFTGIALHFILAWQLARHYGMRRRIWLTVSFCYLLGMIVGAKVLYDIRHGIWDMSLLLHAKHWTDGGLWGGLLAYFALAVPAALLLSARRRAALDLVALTVPIPWIFAKLGCFFNGCCYGRPTSLPWAVTFPPGARNAPPGIPVHPTQLYEMGLMLILLLVFFSLRSDRWQGTRLLWFLVIYGLGRAATDFLRGDTEGRLFLGLLSLTQLLSLLAAAVALVLLGLHLRGDNRPMAGTTTQAQ
jgi:phosphatidylglycerol:prolipoprotein diacylglycerol transferase